MTCGDGEVMNKQPGTIRALFLTFLKIGAFTFGGGYAMIPLIRREIALRETEAGLTDGDILDIIGRQRESTPWAHRRERGHLCGLPGGRAPGVRHAAPRWGWCCPASS